MPHIKTRQVSPTRLLTALLLVPALAACATSAPPTPSTGASAAPATQIAGQVQGNAPITRVKAVIQGSTTVRGADVSVTGGAFIYALPTDASVAALAADLTPTTFGAPKCPGTAQTVSTPAARVAQLFFFDAFNGSAALPYLRGGQVQGNTTTIYVWMYAVQAVNVTRSEACTVDGHPYKDSLDLRLAAGWNSVVGTTTTAVDGSVTSSYFTQPVGTVPFL